MLHAEAIFSTTGNEVDARSFFSQVRARATTNNTSSVLDAAYKKTSFIDELVEERGRGLCYESQRRFDLIRFGKYLSTIANLSEDKSKGWWNPGVIQIKQNIAPSEYGFQYQLQK